MKNSYGIHTRIDNRFYIIYMFIIISFLIILINLYKMIIYDNEKYSKALEEKTSVTYIGENGLRGNIYDRNGKLLVGNQEVNIITYTKNNNTTYKDEILTAGKLSEILDIDYSDVKENDIKEYYYIKNKSYLDGIINEKIKEKREKDIISEKVYKEYIYSLINEKRLEEFEDIDIKSAYIYKLMNEGYSYSSKTIKNDSVTEEEINKINDINLEGVSVGIRYERYYPYGETFKTFLGYLGSIPAEEAEEYYKKGYRVSDIVGVSYLEKQYEDELKGVNEIYTLSATGKKTVVSEAQNGNDIMLSIDIDLQLEVENIIYQEALKAKKEVNTRFYNKSFAIITDSFTGEILASAGIGVAYINNEWQKTDHLSDIVNYAVTPGSIVKGASHLVGYETGAITYGYSVTDSCIKIKNTPKKCSWRSLGRVNDLTALKVSSNYYQYLIAIKVGKGNYYYNGPLSLDKEGFNVYREMYNSFGLGVKTEIDLPYEGLGYIGSDTNPGNLLDFPIGQYDTYTPIQLLQYIMTFANDGVRIAPHYLKSVYASGSELKDELSKYEKRILGNAKASINNINRVQKGLEMVMNGGTGTGYISLKYNPKGKTGTSQSFIDTNSDGTIDQETISTSFGAYASYNDKNISLVVLSPNVSDQRTSYLSYVNQRITKKITDLYFEK